MTQTIKAIETRYNGYRFRSRLEARFAVFLDHLDVDYEYEPEGFDIPDVGSYLPDFFLRLGGIYGGDCPGGKPPVRGFYVEIKGQEPTKDELRKCLSLCKLTGHCVYIVCGEIGKCRVFKFHPRWDTATIWGNIQHQTFHGLTNAQFSLLIYLGQAAIQEPGPIPQGNFLRAMEAARSARFEHGESGAA